MKTSVAAVVDRRAEIRGKAAALFAARGVADTSMSELAAVVGIRKSSLYYFFPSKQDLVMEVLRPVLEQPCRELSEIVASSGSVTDRLVAAAAALGQTFEREPQRMEILVRDRLERHLTEEQMQEIRTWKSEYTDLWRALIREGVQAGLFRPCDDKTAAFAVIGAMNWMYAWFEPSSPLSGAEVGCEVAERFLRGLLVAPNQPNVGGDR